MFKSVDPNPFGVAPSLIPLGGGFFICLNSPGAYDLTYNSYSHNFLFSVSYSGSDSYVYSVPAPFDIKDFKVANVRKRKSKHSKRLGYIMQKYNIKSVSMITLTVEFNGVYRSSREYDNALNRMRRFFNYYKINRVTGSEFTAKGVKHFHIVIDSEDIKNICSLASFKRFVRSYKLTENDIKAIKSGKRSYLEVYIARFLYKRWRLGFVDFLYNAKALYLVKYVNEEYDGQLSLHGRLSYSKVYSEEFKNKSSVVRCGFDNSVVRSVPNFQTPLFFLKEANDIMKRKLMRRLRFEFARSRYKYVYEKYKSFLNCENFPSFYEAVERLSLMQGFD